MVPAAVRWQVSAGDWLWCLHCERCFRPGESGQVQRLQLCPYADCDGTPIDWWSWVRVREVNLDYPLDPEPGKVYPLYGVST